MAAGGFLSLAMCTARHVHSRSALRVLCSCHVVLSTKIPPHTVAFYSHPRESLPQIVRVFVEDIPSGILSHMAHAVICHSRYLNRASQASRHFISKSIRVKQCEIFGGDIWPCFWVEDRLLLEMSVQDHCVGDCCHGNCDTNPSRILLLINIVFLPSSF